MQDFKKLETIQVETQSPVNTVVIWLHGLGADGHDFVNLIPELKLPQEYAIRFIFPHAPMRPVTINQGMIMRAWYDVTSLSSLEHDLVGIEQSTQQVQQLITEQIDLGIAHHRILLAGFSQGGAIALQAGLNYPQSLGGILGLSTYLPAPFKIARAENLKFEMPLALLHGNYDEIIPIGLAKLGRDFLINQGFKVEWHEYPMAHQICLPEIKDIQKWFVERMS